MHVACFGLLQLDTVFPSGVRYIADETYRKLECSGKKAGWEIAVINFIAHCGLTYES